jgi:hypothetical protein
MELQNPQGSGRRNRVPVHRNPPCTKQRISTDSALETFVTYFFTRLPCMRIIGVDIHRAFAEAVAWEDGKLGRVGMRRNFLTAFAATLSPEDIVVVEATGNAAAVASVIGPYVKRVAISNLISPHNMI